MAAAKKKAQSKNPGGRPTAYRAEYAEKVFKLALLGAKDAQLADFFDVSEQTINTWKEKHPKFLEALKAGKDQADAAVADSLYHRALGYTHPEEKIFCTNGVITRTETLKHYPPDTTAAIFWLKNRQKLNWRDRQEHEHTGKDGGPVKVVVEKPDAELL